MSAKRLKLIFEVHKDEGHNNVTMTYDSWSQEIDIQGRTFPATLRMFQDFVEQIKMSNQFNIPRHAKGHIHDTQILPDSR